jgi:ADP-ribosylglycohydrolase
VGAYFADDFGEAVRQAKLSAVITHAHPDGQAGAIAVAVAAAYAHVARAVGRTVENEAQRLFDTVLAYTPESSTRAGIARAASVVPGDPVAAADLLGDGTMIRSSDTVPLALWCAAHHLGHYEAAITSARAACRRTTADRDTVGAIVGSIVVLSSGIDAIPAQWRAAREPLPL